MTAGMATQASDGLQALGIDGHLLNKSSGTAESFTKVDAAAQQRPQSDSDTGNVVTTSATSWHIPAPRFWAVASVPGVLAD